MGMYTELVLKAKVVDEVPQDVDAVLRHLFGEGDRPEVLPEHEFFKCGMWDMVGRCSSYYHTPFALSRYSEGYIFSRSDLKNYDSEIRKFIDWITPYLRALDGDCIGWSWYEECDAPTLLTVCK